MSIPAAVILSGQARLLRHLQMAKAFDPASALHPDTLPSGLASALRFHKQAGRVKETPEGLLYLDARAVRLDRDMFRGLATLGVFLAGLAAVAAILVYLVIA